MNKQKPIPKELQDALDRMPPLARQIAAVIHRVPEGVHIHPAEIAPLVGSNEREVRRLVTGNIRAVGYLARGLICSYPGVGGGYWRTLNAEELVLRHRRATHTERSAKLTREELERSLDDFGLSGLVTLSNEEPA